MASDTTKVEMLTIFGAVRKLKMFLNVSGDTKTPFTMQSCSKPFTYAVCLNELGSETVHQFVGQEPSGRMFNELSLDFNNKPHNPLLNSGAIMSCAILLSLVKPDMKISEKFDFLLEYLKKIGGGEFIR